MFYFEFDKNGFPQIPLIFSLIAQINTLLICAICVYLICVISGKQIMTLPKNKQQGAIGPVNVTLPDAKDQSAKYQDTFSPRY